MLDIFPPSHRSDLRLRSVQPVTVHALGSIPKKQSREVHDTFCAGGAFRKAALSGGFFISLTGFSASSRRRAFPLGVHELVHACNTFRTCSGPQSGATKKVQVTVVLVMVVVVVVVEHKKRFTQIIPKQGARNYR